MEKAWLRRAVTIPALLLATILLVVGLPVWLPIAALVDAGLQRSFAISRLLLFMTGYGVCETMGLVVAGALFVRRGRGDWQEPALQAAHYELQRRWAGAILAVAVRCFGLDLRTVGVPPTRDRSLIVLPRHASLIDSFLPAVVLGGDRWRLRWVMKKSLLFDPCLDVVGHRLPNVFIERGSSDPGAETARVERLAGNLGPGEGLVMFPEGTRFSAARRDRALQRLADDDAERRARLSGLRHLLPPRTRGPQAVLDAAPEADVCIFGHGGFEGFAGLRDLLRGGLVGRRIDVRLRVFPRSELPTQSAGRVAWLDERWKELDDWLEELHEGRVAERSGGRATSATAG